MEFALVSDWKKHPCEEAQLEEIFAKEFSALGHRVHFAAFIPGLPELERRETWHGQPLTLFRREAGTVKPLRRWLTELLKNRPLDFVQVRNDPGFALSAAQLARGAGKPFVYHLSILNGPALIDEAREVSLARRPFQLLKGLVGGALVDRVAMTCDLLLPISAAMAGHYRAMGRKGPIEALPMGCREASAEPAPPPRDFVEALYVGEMDRARRLDFLLRALARARREEPRLRLAFLGPARRPAALEFLRGQVRALGLSGAVSFEAPVPRDAVRARMARADFGVSPVPPTSYFRLSSPTKLMESLGAGRPMVANDIPDQALVLAESGGGICVPYEEEPFARAMVELARDPARRADMGRKGASYMARERDYAVLARRLEAAYRRLLA
ncbi:MAG: glycosyltransferase [Elusimicrobia bacterium]|nr:glycosyltransferase [Elusimicrobiota bacterium]